MKKGEINIKSEEVQEILGTPPSSIVRWGITVVFIVLMIILAMTYIIEYPDVVEGKALISTKKPTIEVASFASGYLEKLFVQDKEKILKGQKIALIESTAKYDDVLKVENLVLELDTVEDISEIFFENKRKSLGEIQNEYNNFISAFNSLSFFYNNNFEAENNKNIKNQMLQVKQQYQKLSNQAQLLRAEMKLLDKQVTERADLYKQKVISREEYEKFKTSYLQKRSQLENYKISLSNNKINQANLQKEISNNSFTRVFRDNETVMKFEEAKDILISKINWWKKKYLIVSPISGNISFGKVWSENQKVTQGENLFTIIPNDNKILAKIHVPLQGIGKIKEGQKILIDLSSYPSQEFGFIESKVQKISLVSNEEKMYKIEAKLDSNIITTFNKEIYFIPNMEGAAKVITEEKRIISRIFEQFNKLMTR